MAWPTEAGSIARAKVSQAAKPAKRARSRFFSGSFFAPFARRFDSLRLFGSGAASDGGAQASEGSNLGNYRSSTELQSLAAFGAMRNITIERVSDAHETGVGSLESDGVNMLRWTAPGSATPGPYTLVPEGQSVVLEDGEDPAKALRVRRSGTFPATGAENIKLLDIFNGAFGFDNVADAERSAGDNEYRCVFLKNAGAGALDLRMYLARLGTPRSLSSQVNRILYSQDLSNVLWVVGGGASKGANNAENAPDGTKTADAISLPSAGAELRQGSVSISTGNVTFSVYVRAQSGTATVRLQVSHGSTTTSSDFVVTTTWQRLSMTVNNSIPAITVRIVPGSAGAAANIYVWGAQAETGTTAGTYAPTEAERAPGTIANNAFFLTPASGDFKDWPLSGFLLNGTTGEVLYYASRSDSVIPILASGRDVFSGGMYANAAGNEYTPIPGLRLAVEEPSAQPSGFVQTVANENTAPTGVSWKVAASDGGSNVIERLSLAAGQQIGLWIHRKIVAGEAARGMVENKIVIDAFVNGSL